MTKQYPTRDTLSELPPDHHIYGRCSYCNRDFEISIPLLIERLGPDCLTIAAMRKVVCATCRRPARTWRGHGGDEGRRRPRPTPV